MAPPIVSDSRLDEGYELVQLKTRIYPETKREIAELAIDSGRTLCSVVDEALCDHVLRARSRHSLLLGRRAGGRDARRPHQLRGVVRRRSAAR